MSDRAILLIVEAEEGLTFFQSFILPREAIGDLDSAVRRIGEYLKMRGAGAPWVGHSRLRCRVGTC